MVCSIHNLNQKKVKNTCRGSVRRVYKNRRLHDSFPSPFLQVYSGSNSLNYYILWISLAMAICHMLMPD